MTIRLRGFWDFAFALAVTVTFLLASPGVSSAQDQDAAPKTVPATVPNTAPNSAPTPDSQPTSHAEAAAPPTVSSPVHSTSDAQKTLPDKPLPVGQQDSDPSAGSKDRLFYAMPNFSTVESSEHLPPMTVGQKFKLVTRASFDPFQFAWYAAIAGISQAENSEPGYGQGWGSYGIRYASAMGDGLTEAYMVGAVFPSVLRQDPRYYQLGHGSFLHRTGYALSRLVITRGDSGNAQFNASEIFGSAVAAGIVTYSYHPHEDKTLSNTASVWGTQVAYDAIAVELKEFWPDLRRKFSQKKHARDPGN
jgi:hypothetical protein